MPKGISTLISIVVVVLISITAIGIVLTASLPTIDRFREVAVIGEAQSNMHTFDDLIRQTASEGAGVVRQAQFSVTDGSYFVNPSTGSLDFNYIMKSNALPKGTFSKEGNLQTSVTGVSSASQNSTNIVLENSILRVVFSNTGSQTNFAGINTSSIINTITSKTDGVTIVPNDTSVIIANITNTSWGLGYTQIAREGNNLPSADMLAHVRSNMTGVEYNVLYSLPGSADFLLINVVNATNNKTTIVFTYKLGSTASGTDIIKVDDTSEIAFTTP